MRINKISLKDIYIYIYKEQVNTGIEAKCRSMLMLLMNALNLEFFWRHYV